MGNRRDYSAKKYLLGRITFSLSLLLLLCVSLMKQSQQGYHCPPFPPFWSSINENGEILKRNGGLLEELVKYV